MITTLIQSLIGTPQLSVTVPGAEGLSPVVVSVVDTQYLLNGAILLVFYIGFIVIISNFQKSFQRGRK